jgi:hypothetical protein
MKPNFGQQGVMKSSQGSPDAEQYSEAVRYNTVRADLGYFCGRLQPPLLQ